jgi:hypothetical protein
MCTDYEGPKPHHKAELDRRMRIEVEGFVPRTRITGLKSLIATKCDYMAFPRNRQSTICPVAKNWFAPLR